MIVNIINVLAEEGMFRGFILKVVTERWGFKTGNYLQTFLFGIWHIVICILGAYDGQMSVGQTVIFAIGYVVLAGILAAFLHNPKIVFLDEPTIGLDVAMKAKIRELIKGLNQEKNTTVILTTHDMGDVDALSQRIVIIGTGNQLQYRYDCCDYLSLYRINLGY